MNKVTAKKIIKLPDEPIIDDSIIFQKKSKFILFLEKIGNYIFSGISLFGVVIFCTLLESPGENFKIFLIMLGISLILLLPLSLNYLFEEYEHFKFETKRKIDFEKFKENADKLNVNLEDTVIISKNDNNKIVVFKIDYSQKSAIIEYKSIIKMDFAKLRSHFIFQKQTVFYIHRDDIHTHFLDLDFLE